MPSPVAASPRSRMPRSAMLYHLCALLNGLTAVALLVAARMSDTPTRHLAVAAMALGLCVLFLLLAKAVIRTSR